MLLLLPLLFILSGCQKDKLVLDNNSDLATTEVVVPKVMVFESGKAFMDMLSKPVEEVRAIQSQLFSGESFTSYDEHFSKIEDELSRLEESGELPETIREIEEQFGVRFEDEDGGKIIVPAVKSPGLAAIANENGLYQIGDTLIQIAYDVAYMAKISEVVDFTDLSTSSNVQTINLYERTAGTKAAVVHECIRNYAYNGKAHRLRVQWLVDYINVPIYGVVIPVTEIYISVRHQKRGFLGAWFANKEQRIWAFGRVTHLTQSTSGNSTASFNVDHEALNSSSLSIRVHLGRRTANISFKNWILNPSFAIHSSRDAGSGPWSCTIVN